MRVLAFPKTKRLLNPDDFAHVFTNVDCKQGGAYFTFLSCANEQGNSRLGIIVAKRHCKRAVDRNRIKRCTRESFRQLTVNFDSTSTPCDVVVIAKAGAAELANQQLNSELNRQWNKLLKKRQART
ncbi:MAG: ribonuclease P protein component [Pseudomonadales bacterium]|nr:ribonuclease P protein component [Gammaproteobacteria bacterium]NNL57239.1 ribonuclease P protein component [Pseudomonadales bacterium]